MILAELHLSSSFTQIFWFFDNYTNILIILIITQNTTRLNFFCNVMSAKVISHSIAHQRFHPILIDSITLLTATSKQDSHNYTVIKTMRDANNYY